MWAMKWGREGDIMGGVKMEEEELEWEKKKAMNGMDDEMEIRPSQLPLLPIQIHLQLDDPIHSINILI